MSQRNTPSQAQHCPDAATAAADPLRLEIVDSAAGLAALTPEWDALSDALPLQTPFTTATWNLLWWQHLRAARLLIHDRLHSFVVRDAHGKLIAIAPMIISVRPGIGACGVKVLQFFGADPNITEIRGMICQAAHADAAIALVQDYLQQHKQLWDWVEWQGLSSAQATQFALPQLAPAKERVICYLPLPAQWEQLKAGLSRNMKEAIRKCANALKRQQHRQEFQVITQTEQLTPALATFFRLHRLRARTPDGVLHANVFRARKSRNFITAYSQAAANQGKLRLFQLSVDGEIVATRLGYVSQRQLYLYYSGYDPVWSKYSVMTTLVIQIMQWAIEQRYEGVNLSTGRDYSKLRWQPQETIQHHAIQISPRARAGLLFKAYVQLRSYPLMQRLSRKN